MWVVANDESKLRAKIAVLAAVLTAFAVTGGLSALELFAYWVLMVVVGSAFLRYSA